MISIEFPYCVYEVTNLTILGKLTRTRTLKKVQTFLDWNIVSEGKCIASRFINMTIYLPKKKKKWQFVNIIVRFPRLKYCYKKRFWSSAFFSCKTWLEGTGIGHLWLKHFVEHITVSCVAWSTMSKPSLNWTPWIGGELKTRVKAWSYGWLGCRYICYCFVSQFVYPM